MTVSALLGMLGFVDEVQCPLHGSVRITQAVGLQLRDPSPRCAVSPNAVLYTSSGRRGRSSGTDTSAAIWPGRGLITRMR